MPFFLKTSKEAAKMLKAVKSYGGNKTPLQVILKICTIKFS